MRKFLVIALILACRPFSIAQFNDDAQAKIAVSKGIDLLYNYDWSGAEAKLNPVKKAYKNHPISHLLTLLQLQYQYLPVEKNTKILPIYNAELSKCLELAKALFQNPKYKKEASYFLMAAYGLVALNKNAQKQYIDAAVEAKRAYNIFSEYKNLKSENPEFLFPSGLYNYYSIQYPISHPIAKPAFLILEKGNKKKGMEELEKAFQTSIFGKVESAAYLINILIKYESNFKKANLLSIDLNSRYPQNTLFLTRLTETYFLNNQISKAKEAQKQLSNKTENYAQIASLTFSGHFSLLDKDYASAAANFSKAIKLFSGDRFSEQYISMAYMGLGEVFKFQKNFPKARLFYKKSLELAENKWIVEKVKTELSKINE
jgi:hypothetical protein